MEERSFYIHLLSDGDIWVAYNENDTDVLDQGDGVTSVAVVRLEVDPALARFFDAICTLDGMASDHVVALLHRVAAAGGILTGEGWDPLCEEGVQKLEVLANPTDEE